jgi:hypothetical protein
LEAREEVGLNPYWARENTRKKLNHGYLELKRRAVTIPEAK